MRTAPYFPKKSLGQHFLHDGNIARNIVAQLDPRPEDHVLEIGPGPGVLTRLLAASGCHLVAADVDARAVEELQVLFPPSEYPRFEAMHADILKVNLSSLLPADGTRQRVIGNLPYNITSQILFHLFDQHGTVSDAVVMMQREVAERILAPEGNKEYGILSVVTQTHAAVRRCFHVSPNVFTPKPKVWSTVLYLRFEDTRLAKIRNYSFFRRLVKATFGQRRKTLSNSLRQLGISRDDIDGEAAAFLPLRPEQLAVADFIALSNLIDHLGGDAGRAGHGEDDGTRKE